MIGLFIGSFDPFTKAHLDICLKLKNSFSKIILVPVSSKEKDLTNINDRINMLKIIKNKYDFIEISNIMKKYSYVNYRIIDLLRNEYGELNIIMGSDLLEKMDSFDNYEYLFENFCFTIIPRNNIDIKKLINDKYFEYKDKIKLLDYHSNISSTMVKKLLKENKDVSDLIDKDILGYINKNKLYNWLSLYCVVLFS